MNFPLVLFWVFFFLGGMTISQPPNVINGFFPPVTYTRKVIFICPLLPPGGTESV